MINEVVWRPRVSLSEAGEAVAEVREEDQEVSTAQDGQQQGKQVPHASTVQRIFYCRLYIISIGFLKLEVECYF
jgi:hypothetical protein